ncbi:zf-HC2 domain-containing protein [Streptomyces microflavus]
MQTTEPHIRVGAYALGVLGRADAFRFEEHLEECPQCRARARELARVTARLAAAGPVVRPGPGLADRLMEAVAAGRRRAGRRRLALVAAAVVLAVGGPWAAADLSAVPADRGRGAGAAVGGGGPGFGGGRGGDGGAARVGYGGGSGGRAGAGRRGVLADRGGPGRQRDGDQLVGRGPGDGLVEVDGGAALRPEAIDRFEVRTAGGRRLVTVTR